MDVLRSFQTVAETGSITRAGELLGRSQPAISLQLKKLEEMLDCSLLRREGNRLVASSQGAQLLGYAERILRLNDEAVSEMTQPALSGNIRLGIPGEYAPTLLPRVLSRFSEQNPGVNLEINCDLSRNLRAEPAGSYDLILALEQAGSNKGLPEPIRADDLVWVGSEDTVKRNNVLPLVMAKEPCLYRARALQALNTAGMPWDLIYTSSDIAGISAALAEGLGITAMARQAVPPSLQILNDSSRLPSLGQVSIYLLYDRRNKKEVLMRLVDAVHASI